MKTRIYVDGYNFYYGLLEKTPYKWLDTVALLKSVVCQIDPNSNIDKTYFFTSPVKAALASKGVRSVQSQHSYLKALKAIHPELAIVYGKHAIRKKKAPIYDGVKPILDRANCVDVWGIEEKKTDVNIGITIVRDSIRCELDQIVVVSNDTDIAPAIKMAKDERRELTVGLIFPLSQSSKRRIKSELDAMAN